MLVYVLLNDTSEGMRRAASVALSDLGVDADRLALQA
jgi:hypothetical protein